MTLSEISSKISSLTGADTNAYSNASRLIDINIWNQKVGTMILDSQDESDFDDLNHGDYPILTVPLSTNRDYAISGTEKMLKMKNLTVFYDGVNGYRGTPIDSQDQSAIAPSSATAQNDAIDSQYSRTTPRYDWKFGSIFLFPRATSTDVSNSGYMVLEWFRAIKDFTTTDLVTNPTTVSPTFDDAFHPILAYGPAYEYCEAMGLPQAERLKRELMDYEARLRKQYSTKQLDRKYSLNQEQENYK